MTLRPALPWNDRKRGRRTPETTAEQARQRDMWRSTEQTAAAQSTTAAETPCTTTVPRQRAQKTPAPTMTAAQQRAKQRTQRTAQRQILQQTKAAARKAGQRLEQMAQVAGKTVRAGIEAIAAAGGGVVLFLMRWRWWTRWTTFGAANRWWWAGTTVGAS